MCVCGKGFVWEEMGGGLGDVWSWEGGAETLQARKENFKPWWKNRCGTSNHVPPSGSEMKKKGEILFFLQQ